jgi:hypothetical protein
MIARATDQACATAAEESMSNDANVSTGRLILVPALVTLAVTLLRLVGELQRWSPTFFSREPGGAGALVGIVWLIPIFAVYFARRLFRAGQAPAARGRAVLFALLGVATFVVLAMLSFGVIKGPLLQLVAGNLTALIAAAVAARGWPALARTLLAYGVAARIPVALVMLLAIQGQWGTHYDLGPPGFPAMGWLATWFFIGLVPQMFFWIGFTVLVGTLVGSLAVLVAPPKSS